MFTCLFCLINGNPQTFTQAAAITDDPQPDLLLDVLFAVVKVSLEHLHNNCDLMCRTLPVFRGKGVDSEVADADLFAVAGNIHKNLAAAAMTVFPRQTACLCPAPVSVHNDADMLREILRGGRRSGSILWHCLHGVFSLFHNSKSAPPTEFDR